MPTSRAGYRGLNARVTGAFFRKEMIIAIQDFSVSGNPGAVQ